MFTLFDRGFHIKFKNGWTVSIQFGPGHYCDNHQQDFSDAIKRPSSTAEIAAWDANNNWYKFDEVEGGNQVSGWQSPENVLAFINLIANKEE